MIFFFHLALGVIIGLKINYLPLAILLAFLSHYVLDYLPHLEYSVSNIKNANWKKSGLDFLKVTIDMGLGFALVIILHQVTHAKYFTLLLPGFFAVLPDFLIILNWTYPNKKILQFHSRVHQITHFPENKKVSVFWRVSSQIITVIISVLLLKL